MEVKEEERRELKRRNEEKGVKVVLRGGRKGIEVKEEEGKGWGLRRRKTDDKRKDGEGREIDEDWRELTGRKRRE